MTDEENFDQREQVTEKETTDTKIEGCNYQLTEDETVRDSYGATEGKMEEVVLVTPFWELVQEPTWSKLS